MEYCQTLEQLRCSRRLAFCALIINSWLVIPGRADIVHLKNGGTVDGELIESNAERYVVRSVVGTIRLPAEAVESVEAGPSPFQEYERRRTAAADTGVDQVALADWCEQNGMLAERRRHLLHAIEIDPECAAARTALGFIRVGEFWVDGRTMGERKRDRPKASDEDRRVDAQDRENERVIAAIQSNWTRRIRAIRVNLLEGSLERNVRTGRSQLLEIHDPLAILPLARVLSNGNRACRETLVEALSGFPEDEATLNLAVVSIVDPDQSIRERALTQLLKRNDPRVAAQFRKALGTNNEDLLRRAAAGVGLLKDTAAVPALIELLKTRQWKMVEVAVPHYFEGFPTTFARPTRASITNAAAVLHAPQIGICDAQGALSIQREQRLENVTVFRTEVLEALKSITGQNYGFDEPAWRRWYEEQKP